MYNHKNQIIMTLSLLTVVGNYLVSSQQPVELQPHNQPNFQNSNNPKLLRAKRMYALCPPEFQKVGNDCFFVSAKRESWLDAHFDCKDRNSKLAEPLKFADRRLRKYLHNKDQTNGEKWIGGMYNHQIRKWQWGYNGGEMKYQAFDKSVDNDNLQFHCTVMDPNFQYKWTAKQCTERHYFICQHRMSFVSEKNRQKVYTKWNETYPNQIANEVEVYVSTNGNNNRSKNKRTRTGSNRLNQVNLKKIDTTASPSPPEYLPFNVYNNLETLQQKPQEEVQSILPLNSPAFTQTNTLSLKQRKRHSRPLKLSGDVDLGLKKQRRQKAKKVAKQDEVQQQQNALDESKINAGRHHNHHHHPNNALPEPEISEPVEISTASSEEAAATTTTTTSSTAAPAIIEQTTMSELKKKLEEKAQRRERLKAKLAQLTPEERQAFILMKQQRAEARKNGLNFGSS